MPEIIEVTVSADGEVTLETRGFRGKTCQEATHSLEEALGARHDERLTAEYYLPAKTAVSAKVGLSGESS